MNTFFEIDFSSLVGKTVTCAGNLLEIQITGLSEDKRSLNAELTKCVPYVVHDRLPVAVRFVPFKIGPTEVDAFFAMSPDPALSRECSEMAGGTVAMWKSSDFIPLFLWMARDGSPHLGVPDEPDRARERLQMEEMGKILARLLGN